jgi:hypothetical protein
MSRAFQPIIGENLGSLNKFSPSSSFFHLHHLHTSNTVSQSIIETIKINSCSIIISCFIDHCLLPLSHHYTPRRGGWFHPHAARISSDLDISSLYRELGTLRILIYFHLDKSNFTMSTPGGRAEVVAGRLESTQVALRVVQVRLQSASSRNSQAVTADTTAADSLYLACQ